MAYQKGQVHVMDGRICIFLGSRHPVEVRVDEAERLAYLLGEAAVEARLLDLARRNADRTHGPMVCTASMAEPAYIHAPECPRRTVVEGGRD